MSLNKISVSTNPLFRYPGRALFLAGMVGGFISALTGFFIEDYYENFYKILLIVGSILIGGFCGWLLIIPYRRSKFFNRISIWLVLGSIFVFIFVLAYLLWRLLSNPDFSSELLFIAILRLFLIAFTLAGANFFRRTSELEQPLVATATLSLIFAFAFTRLVIMTLLLLVVVLGISAGVVQP